MNALVDSLVARMPPASFYPGGVMEPLAPFLSGMAFFPGGSGLFEGAAQPIPAHPIMVVGQDFGTREYVDELKAERALDEGIASTWQVLLDRFLHPNGIDPRHCFFSNALLGVRSSIGITDENPALDDDRFMQACAEFMLEQVRIVRPSVVIGLGVVPATLLASWFAIDDSLPQARCRRRPSIAQVDDAGLQFLDTVEMRGTGRRAAFGWSIHPANAGPNLKWRRWPAEKTDGAAANDLVWRRAAAARARAVTMP